MNLKLKFRPIYLLLVLIMTITNCSDQTLDVQEESSESLLSSPTLSKAALDSTRRAERLVSANDNSANIQAPAQALAALSENYARQAVVSAESTYSGYSVARINDGNRNTTVGPAYSWTNNFVGGGKLPESVFLRFSGPKSINRIDIYTSTGYALQNYTIQYRTSTTGSWVTVLSITGNTAIIRTHNITTISALEIQIICQLGPSNQTIYGRLNEVEIYGNAPSLPSIGVENGMLSFSSHADVIQTLDYLEYMYDQHDDAFLAQYPNKTDDELAAIEESIGYNDEQPYANFENQFGIYSKRAQITSAEDFWLATTPGEDEATNPDNSFVEDDEVRTIVNANGEVKIGSTYYKFNADGTYYVVSGSFYQELVALRNLKPQDALPPHVTIVNASPNAAIPGCQASKRKSDKVTVGSWRFKWVVSIWNFPWNPRIMAKTKSFKKVNGRWKKRRTTIGAQAYGTVQNLDCAGSQYLESPYKQKRKKKVKSHYRTSIYIKAFTGDVKGYHYSGQVGTYISTLNW